MRDEPEGSNDYDIRRADQRALRYDCGRGLAAGSGLIGGRLDYIYVSDAQESESRRVADNGAAHGADARRNRAEGKARRAGNRRDFSGLRTSQHDAGRCSNERSQKPPLRRDEHPVSVHREGGGGNHYRAGKYQQCDFHNSQPLTPMSTTKLQKRFVRPAIAALAILASASTAAPLSAQIAVLGNTVKETVAVPGETYMGTLVIRNLTTNNQITQVYQTDYLFDANGTSKFERAGTVARSNAAWIVPSANSFVLPPSGEMTLTYVVKVPARENLRGTYWSVIMIEGSTNGIPVKRNIGQVGLSSVMRYAVQVATHIESSGAQVVGFSAPQFSVEADGTRQIDVDVSNTGERAFHPMMWAEVYDAGGTQKARVEQQRGLLYPGTSMRQHFALGKLPAGKYKVVVFADVGADKVSASQYELSF